MALRIKEPDGAQQAYMSASIRRPSPDGQLSCSHRSSPAPRTTCVHKDDGLYTAWLAVKSVATTATPVLSELHARLRHSNADAGTRAQAHQGDVAATSTFNVPPLPRVQATKGHRRQ